MVSISEALGRAQSARDTSWQREQGTFLCSYKTKPWTAGSGPLAASWVSKPEQHVTLLWGWGPSIFFKKKKKISDEKRWMN